MQHLSGDLGVELPERAYGANCTIYDAKTGVKWDTIRETVFDEFVLAHIFGWWAKALMLRNHFLLWILSIGFEVMELTFQVISRPEYNRKNYVFSSLWVVLCHLYSHRLRMGIWTPWIDLLLQILLICLYASHQQTGVSAAHAPKF